MGSCIGRCFCEVGKCFCCDCFVFKSNLTETITRRSRKNKTQTFTLRRQSSSTTIEFENLMFEFDIPDTSTSMIQMHPTSVSSWVALRNNQLKEKGLDSQQLTVNSKGSDLKPFHVFKSFTVCNTDVNSNHDNQNNDHFYTNELPIIDSLISRSSQLRTNSSPDNREKISLGGSSSLGELQWENEIINDDFNGNEQNGNELEWDNYEEDTMAFHNEAEQLIYEIEELTHSTINDLS